MDGFAGKMHSFVMGMRFVYEKTALDGLILQS